MRFSTRASAHPFQMPFGRPSRASVAPKRHFEYDVFLVQRAAHCKCTAHIAQHVARRAAASPSAPPTRHLRLPDQGHLRHEHDLRNTAQPHIYDAMMATSQSICPPPVVQPHRRIRSQSHYQPGTPATFATTVARCTQAKASVRRDHKPRGNYVGKRRARAPQLARARRSRMTRSLRGQMQRRGEAGNVPRNRAPFSVCASDAVVRDVLSANAEIEHGRRGRGTTPAAR